MDAEKGFKEFESYLINRYGFCNWQCKEVWVAASEFQHRFVGPCPTCGEFEPNTGCCGTSDSDTRALCKRSAQ